MVSRSFRSLGFFAEGNGSERDAHVAFVLLKVTTWQQSSRHPLGAWKVTRSGD